MSILQKTLRQAGKPQGWLGRSIVRGMNSGHSRLASWSLGLVDIARDLDVLDIGCGGGGTVRRLAGMVTQGKVVGIDYSPDAVAVARKTNRALISQGRVEIIVGDVSSMRFGDGTFDLVTAIETHYFWPDLPSDLREVHRVTKPGGRLLVVGALYKDGTHERRNQRIVAASGMTYHSIAELRALLEGAGWSDIEAREDAGRGWFAASARA